jgi:hypothetical protein
MAKSATITHAPLRYAKAPEIAHTMTSDYFEAPIIEPNTIDSIYVTGIEIDADDYAVRITGWIMQDGGAAARRRIVTRLVTSPQTARQLRAKLADMLGGQGGHAVASGMSWQSSM